MIFRHGGGDPKTAVVIKSGAFFNHVVDFLIVAFRIFLAVKGFNRLRKKEEAKPTPPPGPNEEQKLLGEVRDILKVK